MNFDESLQKIGQYAQKYIAAAAEQPFLGLLGYSEICIEKKVFLQRQAQHGVQWIPVTSNTLVEHCRTLLQHAKLSDFDVPRNERAQVRRLQSLNFKREIVVRFRRKITHWVYPFTFDF